MLALTSTLVNLCYTISVLCSVWMGCIASAVLSVDMLRCLCALQYLCSVSPLLCLCSSCSVLCCVCVVVSVLCCVVFSALLCLFFFFWSLLCLFVVPSLCSAVFDSILYVDVMFCLCAMLYADGPCQLNSVLCSVACVLCSLCSLFPVVCVYIFVYICRCAILCLLCTV